MKKELLFGIMLFGAATALSAGEVQQDESKLQSQTIPTPEDTYLDFSKGYCYYAGTDANAVVSDDGISLGNMRDGTYVVLQLDNTVANNGYTLAFQGGNKNEGGKLAVSLFASNPISDDAAEPFFSQEVTIQAKGNWDDKDPYSVTISTEVPQAVVYLKLQATRSNTVAYSGNFTKFTMTAIESQLTYYTLTTKVNNEEWGKVTGNDAESYAEGSQVTLNATANEGYRFVNWTIGAEESTENPLQLTISADTEVLATFEEIPNALNSDLIFDIAAAYSTSGTINVDNGEVPSIGSIKNNASVTYKFEVPATDDYNVVARWAGKYATTITMNVSTDLDSFSEETAVAVDMTATEGWDDFVGAKWASFNLEVAKTYYLRISFATADSWAGNINYLALQSTSNDGVADLLNDETKTLHYYNLQGIEVNPADARGLLITSKGQKIYRK